MNASQKRAWSLKSDEEAAVFEKVMKAGKPLGEYVEGKFFRGVTFWASMTRS